MAADTRIETEGRAEGAADPQTVKVGLLGRGIQLSRTPAMHEAEGAALGIDYQYTLFDTAEMPSGVEVSEILSSAERSGYAGLNVTYPYKVAVMDYLDELSDAARALGAVNTIVFRNGRRKGHNTDWWGFSESFRRNMNDVSCGTIVQVGAGGAGAAVAHALVDRGAGELRLFDREHDKATALVERINEDAGRPVAKTVSSLAAAFEGQVDGIVNATPVGMATQPGTPVPADFIQPSMWVADIVYFPLETELLRMARQKECRVLPGSGMAVFQAVRAFEHFTGLVPDSGRMEAAFNRFDSKDRT